MTGSAAAPDPGTVNNEAWTGARAVAELAAEGWSDPGERPALTAFADKVRGGRVLELGVGTGRLIPLLRLTTEHYLGIDFNPAVLERAGRINPGAELRHDDARELATIPDGSVDGVVFAFNGIDAVDHAGRLAVLAAVHRALVPGGHFLYSTLNRNGPAYGQRPWRVDPLPWVVGSLRPARGGLVARSAFSALRIARDPGRPLRLLRNWRRLRPGEVDQGGWAIGINDAHDFGLLVHYTTVTDECERASAAGFDVVATFAAEDGAPVTDVTTGPQPRWFHLLVRRR